MNATNETSGCETSAAPTDSPTPGRNDSTPGGSYTANGTTANKFFRFFGDSNGDGAVNQTVDFIAFRNAFGFPSSIFDFDNSGDVDQAADFVKFKNNFGLTP